MANKPQPGVLERALRDGTLARLAPHCRSQNELAARLGLSKDAFISQKVRLIAKGVAVPSFEELRAANQNVVAQDSTNPHIGSSFSDFAAEQGIEVDVSDLTDPPLPAVPRGFDVRHVSTLVDGVTGEIKQQWIKTSAQNDERKDWLEAIRSMSAELPRVDGLSSLPAHQDRDLLAVYPVGDPHIGLLSWREDAGENFDLGIAEQRYISAFKHLISLAPPAHEALVILIGDTAHADGQNNTTTKGTRVDVDGRTVKMARTIIRVARYAIDTALEKHGRVTMIIERGNHDELISAMLALALSFVYENEPRVKIDTSPQMFHWFRWGANLIGTHHGDKVKPMDLLGVMAVDRAADWSETVHRRFYAGHFHHQIVKEVPGLIVEYLPTLASSDAWHHAMGYRSAKAMYMDVLHRELGHINRHIVGLNQLRAA